jgi:hypothetical protein
MILIIFVIDNIQFLLVFEKNGNGAKKGNEYWYNNLNQQIRKLVDGKDNYSYEFDNRGNLIKGVYHGNRANSNKIIEGYIYDATNRMAMGANKKGEQSHYIYNGLGYLVGNEWIIEKNAYGYHGVGAHLDPADQVNGVVVCDRHSNSTGQGHINPIGKGHTAGGTIGGVSSNIDNKKFAVVHKDFVLDYTSPLRDVIMEYEGGGGALAYRYVYGLDKVETVIYGALNGAGPQTQYLYNHVNGKSDIVTNGPSGAPGEQQVVKLYYHHGHLGGAEYLTDNVAGKVTSYVSYDDWGALTSKAILKMGVRELDLVQEYTGHPYDQVLGLYYAKARMYDPAT